MMGGSIGVDGVPAKGIFLAAAQEGGSKESEPLGKALRIPL
jgi:hypothetical protein